MYNIPSDVQYTYIYTIYLSQYTYALQIYIATSFIFSVFL